MGKKDFVLVLEDEDSWRKWHVDTLKKAGLKIESTSDFQEAINIVNYDKKSHLKAAIVDELLFYYEETGKEPQNKQGSHVLGYIKRRRPDIVRIMVTGKPEKVAPENSGVAIEIWEKLRREGNAEEIFYKGSLKKNYQPLIDYLKKAIEEKGKHIAVSKDDTFFIIADNTAYYVPKNINIKQKLAQYGGMSNDAKIYNFFSRNHKNLKQFISQPKEHTFRLLLSVADKLLKNEGRMFTREDLAQVFYGKKLDTLFAEEISKIQPNLMESEWIDSFSMPKETPGNVQLHMQARLESRELPPDVVKEATGAVRRRIRVQRSKVNKRLCRVAGVSDGLFVEAKKNAGLWKANFFVFRVKTEKIRDW